jgi:hypothetical protein
MRWQGREGSSNVEDRRRGGGNAGRVGAGLGIGGTIIVVLFALLTGQDPSQILQQASSDPYAQSAPAAASPEEDALAQFVGVVLKDNEDVWATLFPQVLGSAYRLPKLVLFSGSTQSACGFASAATGPFYCPADEKIYIDLAFYSELKNRFGAAGDFAMAYVISHEVGHHVQNLLGTLSQVDAQRGRISEERQNQLSVRVELQADFYAGVWAHHAQQMKNILEEGDVEEALRAAQAIGDDRLQMQAQGYVVPESFTHGTSEQRMRWFLKGLKTGDMRQGDTFGARQL